MARTGRIEGRVVSQDGTPLAQVSVLLSAGVVEQQDAATASTSDGGDYRVNGLEPGAYTVRISSRTHGEHATRISVRPTATTRLDFILPA
jgi:hypothetical protein